MMERLAVYGTLKKGFWNYPVLGAKKEFVGSGKTAEAYWMPGLGEGPPVVTKLPAIAPIRVEVYDVEKAQLEGDLDRIEANGVNYTREKTKITLDDGKEVEAWLYFHNRSADYWDDTKLLPNHPQVEEFNWKATAYL